MPEYYARISQCTAEKKRSLALLPISACMGLHSRDHEEGIKNEER